MDIVVIQVSCVILNNIKVCFGFCLGVDGHLIFNCLFQKKVNKEWKNA